MLALSFVIVSLIALTWWDAAENDRCDSQESDSTESRAKLPSTQLKRGSFIPDRDQLEATLQ